MKHCKDCRFYYKDSNKEISECRRRSPTTYQQEIEGELINSTFWPDVDDYMGCGEWEMDELCFIKDNQTDYFRNLAKETAILLGTLAKRLDTDRIVITDEELKKAPNYNRIWIEKDADQHITTIFIEPR